MGSGGSIINVSISFANRGGSCSNCGRQYVLKHELSKFWLVQEFNSDCVLSLDTKSKRDRMISLAALRVRNNRQDAKRGLRIGGDGLRASDLNSGFLTNLVSAMPCDNRLSEFFRIF